MSETTKRAIPTDLMDLGTRWAERVDATHLIAKPVPYHAARANLRAAEGGAEGETTNPLSEIGRGCTGRKMALVTCILDGCLAYVVGLIVAAWFGCIVGAVSALVAAVLIALVLTSRDMPRRASGGEGV
ncbi:hypothetical protein [Asaia bogorensis]|uniref:hypothetical protein n=1 Tax=Asaia bogorensis TaxID=91915 RepID=UPI000EFC87F2|nr:hypothetical protein [Asaia bogorensis]